MARAKKGDKQTIKNNSYTEFLLYTTPNGKVKVEIFLKDENIWLTQARIAELFGIDRSVVTKHLQNIFKEGELDKKSTSAKIAQVQNEGQRQVTRNAEFYNLDYAEIQAQKGIAMYMKDWVKKLDAFLQFNERDILQDNGEISHEIAETLALDEYEKYKKVEDINYISDFDREVKKLLEIDKKK